MRRRRWQPSNDRSCVDVLYRCAYGELSLCGKFTELRHSLYVNFVHDRLLVASCLCPMSMNVEGWAPKRHPSPSHFQFDENKMEATVRSLKLKILLQLEVPFGMAKCEWTAGRVYVMRRQDTTEKHLVESKLLSDWAVAKGRRASSCATPPPSSSSVCECVASSQNWQRGKTNNERKYRQNVGNE